MAFDEHLGDRVRVALASADAPASERRMFGGLAFMVRGHMTVGILGDELLVRVGPEAFEDALDQPHTRIMDFTGRPSRNMVMVAQQALADDGDLDAWVQRGLAFTSTLPPK